MYESVHLAGVASLGRPYLLSLLSAFSFFFPRLYLLGYKSRFMM